MRAALAGTDTDLTTASDDDDAAAVSVTLVILTLPGLFGPLPGLLGALSLGPGDLDLLVPLLLGLLDAWVRFPGLLDSLLPSLETAERLLRSAAPAPVSESYGLGTYTCILPRSSSKFLLSFSPWISFSDSTLYFSLKSTSRWRCLSWNVVPKYKYIRL